MRLLNGEAPPPPPHEPNRGAHFVKIELEGGRPRYHPLFIVRHRPCRAEGATGGKVTAVGARQKIRPVIIRIKRKTLMARLFLAP